MNTRMREILERKQTAPLTNNEDEKRAQRYAENAKRHLAEQADTESWLNESKVRNYLENQMDANPVEIEDTLNVLRTSTIFTLEDRENGSAINSAFAIARGEM